MGLRRNSSVLCPPDQDQATITKAIDAEESAILEPDQRAAASG